MKFLVKITPRSKVRHPPSEAVLQALHQLGFKDITALSLGRVVVIEASAEGARGLRKDLPRYADKELANPHIEDFRIEESNSSG
ncbi:MAG: phosphoribosylformylglycinamidine synthase subunit PurS [Candidatus Taylorbacteria bacterium]|nr:phosphoribosylformylglycinamidine synthase subunit PurS [Candidatus Taylorbacteria bacterium]